MTSGLLAIGQGVHPHLSLPSPGVGPLTREQVAQLRDLSAALLTRLDPEGRMTALYDPAATGQLRRSLDRSVSWHSPHGWSWD